MRDGDHSAHSYLSRDFATPLTPGCAPTPRPEPPPLRVPPRHVDQQLFPAELDLARTQRDELVAVVTLYRALGGGWRLDVPGWSAAPDRSAAREKPSDE